MKKMILSLLLTLSIPTLACHGGDAQEGTAPHPGDKTKLYCEQENTGTCAYVWFQSSIDTKTEGKFVIKFNTNDLDLSKVKVHLWMGMGGHGHGSAPLALTEIPKDALQVSNAWFVMAGTWDLVIEFSENGITKELKIPITIEK